MHMPVGPVPAPTSGPACPPILFLKLFKLINYASTP